MATSALIPVSEYLSTSYRPDREYIDGELREKPVGEKPHAGLQATLAMMINVNRKLWGFRAFTDCRVQVSPSRYRLPDVCALRLPAEVLDGIVHSAPALCIEILSPGDSLNDMQERVDDYVGMGVENIWIIDPVRRRFWTADADSIHVLKAEAFAIPGSLVRITLAEINEDLNDIAIGM